MSRKRPRDSQRSKLYRAEDFLMGKGQSWETTAEIQAYVDHLVSLAWFQRRWPLAAIAVNDGRGRRSACGSTRRALSGKYYGYIKLPRWARTQSVVLHEIAHCCASIEARRNREPIASHGWQFARTLLELVRHEMGNEHWETLRASFREHRVRHKQPRRLSPAARAAAAQRLKDARLAAEHTEAARART